MISLFFLVWALSPSSAKMPWGLKLFGNSWGNPCTKFVMLHIKYCFTCGESDLRETIQKCRNIMASIVWKICFTLYSSNDDATFWEKYQFWLGKVSLFRKQLIVTIESFLDTHFDLNQGYKIVLTQNLEIWNF